MKGICVCWAPTGAVRVNLSMLIPDYLSFERAAQGVGPEGNVFLFSPLLLLLLY